MLKICAIGDLHCDQRSPRYGHSLEVLDAAIALALQRGAQAFFFLGDIVEGDPSGSEYLAFLQRLMRLEGRPIGIINGNHESYDALSFIGLLSSQITVAWDDFKVVHLGETTILLMPYPRRGRAPFDGLEDDGTIAGNMRAAANRIADVVRQHKTSGPLIVLGHFTVAGMSTKDASFEVHSLSEVVVPLTAFEPADLVAVGHIHKRQTVTDKIRGVGSLYRTTFAEADDPKSFCLITVDGDRVTAEDIDVPARGMREFAVELESLSGVQIREMEDAAAAGNEIKVVLSMDATEAARYDPAVFDTVKATAPLFVLEKCVRPVTRVRAPELRADMTVAEEFFAWTQATGVAIADTTRIKEKLRTLD